jgi:hypothetical protein
MGKLPLTAWPKQAFPFEPAHGFFRRLAEANSQQSTRVLADFVGVAGRNVVHEELLDFVTQFPVRDIDEMVRFTPVITGANVILNGELLDKLDYSILKPRCCPACLRDSSYHRNWFDITLLRGCPIHQLKLSDRAVEGVIAPWHPDLGDTAEANRATVDLSWERYILGRMNVMDPTPNAFLDCEPLKDIARIAVLIGRALEAGPRDTPAPRSLRDRSELAGAGFEILSHGDAGLVDFLFRSANARGFGIDGSPVPCGAISAIGWIGGAFARRDDSPLGRACRASVRDAAHRLGIFTRKGVNTIAEIPPDLLTLNECSTVVGVSPQSCRRIAIRLGLARQDLPRSHCHAFTAATAEKIRLAIETSLGRDETAQALGLDGASFTKFATSAGLLPLARLGGATITSDRYLHQEVAYLFSKIRPLVKSTASSSISFAELCSRTGLKQSEIALQLIRGERACTGWASDGAGFQRVMVAPPRFATKHPSSQSVKNKPRGRVQGQGMTFADAAAALDATPNVVRSLVEAGYLHQVLSGGGGRVRLTHASVAQFGAKFASGRAYARAKGTTPQRIFADFKAQGIIMLPPAAVGGYLWIDRESVVQELGMAWDLQSGNVFAETFWLRLRDHWDATGSANRLAGTTGCSATIISGRGDVLASLQAEPSTSSVEMLVKADRRSPKRLARVQNGLERLVQSWTCAGVKLNTNDEVELRQTFRLGADPFAIPDAVTAIDNIATALRMIICPRAPAVAGAG